MACAAAHPRFLGEQDQPGMYVRFNPRSDIIFVIGAEDDRVAVTEAPTDWEGGILEYVETQGRAERVLGRLERISRFSDEDLSDKDKQQKLKDLSVLVEGSKEGKRLSGHDIIGFDVPGLDLRRLHAMSVAKIHQALGMTARNSPVSSHPAVPISRFRYSTVSSAPRDRRNSSLRAFEDVAAVTGNSMSAASWTR